MLSFLRQCPQHCRTTALEFFKGIPPAGAPGRPQCCRTAASEFFKGISPAGAPGCPPRLAAGVKRVERPLIDKLRERLPDCLIVTGPAIDWDGVERVLPDTAASLRATGQDPVWHAEGNVWNHTKLVAEALTRLPYWPTLPDEAKTRLFLAALLHDIGKPAATRIENGRVVSPRHAEIGAREARVILWDRLGLNTDPQLIAFREEVVSLIRFHSLAVHFQERSDPLLTAVRFSMVGKNAELAAIGQADYLGREGNALDESLEKIERFRLFAEEHGILDRPYRFADDHSKIGYFSGRLQHPSEVLRDDTWGEVIILSGLPASGKDTYIKNHLSDRPMVSLDAWRDRLGIGWTENQDRVVDSAHRQAAGLLRQRTEFVWNATFLRRDFRQTAIQLCRRYGARVRIIWLEASLEELRRRNRLRPKSVPDEVYDKRPRKIDFPTPLEAEKLDINP